MTQLMKHEVELTMTFAGNRDMRVVGMANSCNRAFIVSARTWYGIPGRASRPASGLDVVQLGMSLNDGAATNGDMRAFGDESRKYVRRQLVQLIGHEVHIIIVGCSPLTTE